MCPFDRALMAMTLGASLMVGSCASQPSRFYLLSALPNSETAASETSSAQSPTLGVGPVTLPPYLDRPQIVTRASLYEIKLAEFDRWAEALDINFSRTLTENLSILLPTMRVLTSPRPRATPIDYQVTVEVAHFLSQLGGDSLLIADWTLYAGDNQQLLATGKSRFNATPAGPDYASIVAAMSQTVAGLSREISASVKGGGPRISTRKSFSGKVVTR